MKIDLNSLLENHYQGQYSDSSLWDQLYSENPHFRYEGKGFRASIIREHSSFDPNLSLKKYTSWSYSLSGIKEFLTHEYQQNLEFDGSKIVFIVEAEISGIDISKMIKTLNNNESIHYDFKSHLSEEEIIALTINKNKIVKPQLNQIIDIKTAHL